MIITAIVTSVITAVITKAVIMRRCQRVIGTLFEVFKDHMDPEDTEFCACGECDGEGHTLDEYYSWDGQWTEDNL
jgi:hypothetical protein